MSSSDLYAHETELADWCEMLMRWMKRTNAAPLADQPVTMWERFRREYPSVASEMEAWLEERHNND